MFLVGLTGGIGSGKSTISSMFREMDVYVIDADEVARSVVKPGKRAWNNIIETFGTDILEPDGTINRQKLGAIIFADPSMRKKLNSCTHMNIAIEICYQIVHAFLDGHPFIVIDSPLLFEANIWCRFVSYIIVVSCSKKTQIKRVMNRDNFTRSEVLARINAQMPLKDKCKAANYVIDNNVSIEFTIKQVQNVLMELRQSNLHLKIRLGLLIFSLFLVAIICYMIKICF